MRIVFFQWDLGRGGAEKVAFYLSNYLSSKGNKVHMCMCRRCANDFRSIPPKPFRFFVSLYYIPCTIRIKHGGGGSERGMKGFLSTSLECLRQRRFFCSFGLWLTFRTNPAADVAAEAAAAMIPDGIVPVRLLRRKQTLDRWEDSILPIHTKYNAKVNVTYDTNYIFRVRRS